MPPGDPRFEENDRPLSASGRAAADRLALDLAGEPVTAIWSSPYPRARQTVEPLARRVGIEIETVDDLRERLLSPGPLPDWREHLERTWLDDGHRLPGGESNAEAAARIAGVVADAQDAWRRVVVAAVQLGVPAPGFASALAYYDGLRRERLPAALVQGLRDLFWADTYSRVDREGTFHTLWSGDGSEVRPDDTSEGKHGSANPH